MFKDLLSSRHFAPLLLSSIFGTLTIALVLWGIVSSSSWHADFALALGLLALIGPSIVMSASGGTLADTRDAIAFAKSLKVYEFAVVAVAAAGCLLQAPALMFLALLGIGALGAVASPVTIRILSNELPSNQLTVAIGLLTAASGLALAAAAALAFGTYLTSNTLPSFDAEIAAVCLIGLAAVSWLATQQLPMTTRSQAVIAATPFDLRPVSSTRALMADITSPGHDKRILLISGWAGTLVPVLALLLLGAASVIVPTTSANDVARQMVLNGALVLCVFASSLALGALLAVRASAKRPNLALIPLGAGLIGLVALGWALSEQRIGFHLTMNPSMLLAGGLIGFGYGVALVPSLSTILAAAPTDGRGYAIARYNFVAAAVALVFATALAIFHGARFSSGGFGMALPWGLVGLAGLAIAYIAFKLWDRVIVKDFGALVFKTLLRLEVKGEENLPPAGTRAIIAPNHISLLDAAILHSTMPAHSTYAIDTAMSQKSWIKPFLRLVNWHSVDPTRPLGMRELINGVKGGEQLVIFPEGRLTTTGSLMKVYDGTALIADKGDAVVVPVRIEGPQRAKNWSYLRPTQIKKVWFPKTTLTILPPVKLEVDPALRGKVRRQAAGIAMQDMMINAAVATSPMDCTLFEALCQSRNKHDTGAPIVEDPLGTKLSYKKLIVGAQVLGAKLAGRTQPGEAVGVLLPNSAGVAVVFFALQTTGRVAAMLNFTSGSANAIAACKAAGVKTVLTSRTFIEKGRLGDLIAALEPVVTLVYLDDVRPTITLKDKIAGLARGSKPQVARKPDDAAAILFTSGSEGTPKGVVLSHRNMLANVYQVLARMDVNGEDKVFNALPVFHSFGLTAGCVMPIIGGIPVHLYPTPLHYRIIPELAYQTNATILFGTDTFLNGYARAAHPYDLARVRMVVSGAEAVKERTRQVYMEKFGVRILEGYGVTEAAPVVSVNTPMANRQGTVGRLSPLMEARLEPVAGVNDGGRLFVRGPNVMLGYYRSENPGVLEVPPGGWHDTGDIVAIDAQGYISIKGRLKRFAKIGGEMISLSAVESLSAELWPGLITVVVARPDARKGERLVLLTTDAKCTRAALQQFAKSRGVTELMVPADVLVVDKIPLLGSGKPDFVAATKLVAERMGGGSVSPEPTEAVPVADGSDAKSIAAA